MRQLTPDEMARHIDILQQQLASERQRFARAIKVLTAIYTYIYPQLKTTADGRTFRFAAPDPHVYLQSLGDEIRAIPEAIAAIERAAGPLQPDAPWARTSPPVHAPQAERMRLAEQLAEIMRTTKGPKP